MAFNLDCFFEVHQVTIIIARRHGLFKTSQYILKTMPQLTKFLEKIVRSTQEGSTSLAAMMSNEQT
jgi:hypothetical protein